MQREWHRGAGSRTGRPSLVALLLAHAAGAGDKPAAVSSPCASSAGAPSTAFLALPLRLRPALRAGEPSPPPSSAVACFALPGLEGLRGEDGAGALEAAGAGCLVPAVAAKRKSLLTASSVRGVMRLRGPVPSPARAGGIRPIDGPNTTKHGVVTRLQLSRGPESRTAPYPTRLLTAVVHPAWRVNSRPRSRGRAAR